MAATATVCEVHSHVTVITRYQSVCAGTYRCCSLGLGPGGRRLLLLLLLLLPARRRGLLLLLAAQVVELLQPPALLHQRRQLLLPQPLHLARLEGAQRGVKVALPGRG